MNLILCVDENGGMLFNGRRVSRDKEIIKKIAELVGENKLYISEYSAPLFEGSKIDTVVDNAYFEKAESGYFFVEKEDMALFKNVKTITLFNFNRKYPSDKKFNRESVSNARLLKAEEFKGNSHEKITMEVYSLE